MGNKCGLNNVMYQVKISTLEKDHKTYIDSTKRTFNPRYNEHRASFPKPFNSNQKIVPNLKTIYGI